MSYDLTARAHSDPAATRRFVLLRDEDETGISGTGLVAFGVRFPDGVAVTRWNSEVAQTCVWQSMFEVEAVHGHGGRTRVEWVDPDPAVDDRCHAVTVLTDPWEVVRCDATAGHPNQHGGHDSAGTPLLWWEEAVVYRFRGNCFCAVDGPDACPVHPA